MVNSRYSIES